MDCSEPETDCGQSNWLMLKSIRAKFNLTIEEERKEFIRQIYPVINDWKGQYPNLRDIFRSEEVDWLLSDSIDIWCEGPNNDHGRLFIIFVTRSGYKDEPIVGEDGKPSLRRITAVHLAARHEVANWKHQVCWLFRIYDKFHLNYIGEGLTHFHVACLSDCEYVVGKFIELGQDPNLLVPKTGDSPLHLAVENNYKGVVQLLLESGANPNLTDKNGLTPLHLICSDTNDNDDLAMMLFELSNVKYQPLNINAQNQFGNTPLHLAVCSANRKLVKFLLRRGAHSNLANEEGFTPLHYIGQEDVDGDMAELFFNINDDIQQSVQIDARDKDGDTPLHLALNSDNKKAFEIMLKKGADPNCADEDGWTALHFICQKTDNDFMELFFKIIDDMQQTVQIDARDNKGWTPLHMALNLGNKKAFEMLLRRGADANVVDQDGWTAPHIIGQKHNDDIMEIFFEIIDDIQQSVQIDSRDKDGDTPLHLALENGNVKAAEILLRRGANPNSANEKGSTPLHTICMMKEDDGLVDIFFGIIDEMQQTMQIDALDKKGNTPLHLALYSGNKKAFETLLKRGADPNCADEDGWTALHFVCHKINDDNMELFFKIIDDIQKTVHFNAREKLGRTPLLMTLRSGNKKAFEILLRRGADPNCADENGRTALHLICSQCYDGDLMEMFFQINDEKNQMVQVNTVNNFGRTPLQLAVANLLPNAVDLLLDRGADLSNFVFPSERYFTKNKHIFDDETSLNFNLRLASAALAVVERLEIRGYELERSDTLTIMKFLTKHGVFKNSGNDQLWDSDENLVSKAKKILMNPSMSFYELVQSQTK